MEVVYIIRFLAWFLPFKKNYIRLWSFFYSSDPDFWKMAKFKAWKRQTTRKSVTQSHWAKFRVNGICSQSCQIEKWNSADYFPSINLHIVNIFDQISEEFHHQKKASCCILAGGFFYEDIKLGADVFKIIWGT